MIVSLVQLVAGVTVMVAPCPAYHQPFSCYQPETRTIYLLPHSPRIELMHEYGHAYDLDGHADHALFRRVLGFPKSQGWWQETRYQESPAEAFAEAYGQCALGLWNRACRYLPRTSVLRASAEAALLPSTSSP